MEERNPIWDNRLNLTSSSVNGSITIKGVGNDKSQDCSAPVSNINSWMNDFGSKVNGVEYTVPIDFSNKTSFDTYSLGAKGPGKGGGVGLCDLSDFTNIEHKLSGSGNVEFTATTDEPKSSGTFSVPLTGHGVDVGLIEKPVTVYIYSN